MSGPISLTTGVTGVLPTGNGGTGLGSIGSPLQVIRVKADGTGLEYYTVGTGLPSASAAGQTVIWNGSAYVAGALDLADTDAVTGSLPTARIADDAVTYDKLIGASAASRVLIRGSAGGAGNWQEGTVGVGIRVNGTQLELSAALAPLATLGTASQQPRVNSGATALEYYSPDSLALGADLGDASVTIDASQGSIRIMRPSTTTAARNIDLSCTVGSPETNEVIQILVYAQGHDVTVRSVGGSSTITLHVVTSGTKRLVQAVFDGVNWVPLPKGRLA